MHNVKILPDSHENENPPVLLGTSLSIQHKVGHTWVERSLRSAEWQINPFSGALVVPRFGRERAFNEAASMMFIAEHTNIPVPKLHCRFEDDEAVYLVMEYVEGVCMNELEEEKRKIVEEELQVHSAAMKTLKSKFWGGPSGIVRCLFGRLVISLY